MRSKQECSALKIPLFETFSNELGSIETNLALKDFAKSEHSYLIFGFGPQKAAIRYDLSPKHEPNSLLIEGLYATQGREPNRISHDWNSRVRWLSYAFSSILSEMFRLLIK